MIPFQKVFTLLIRTFSKPLLAYAKKQQHFNKLPFFRWFFIRVGRKYHSFEHWLNHSILKTTHKKQLAELKEEILLEKGLEGFFEVVFYSIVFGIPLYELHKSTVSAEKKEAKLCKQIYDLEKQLQEVKFNVGQALFVAKKRSREHKRIAGEYKTRMEEVAKEKRKKWEQLIYEVVLPEEDKEQINNSIEQIADEERLTANSESTTQKIEPERATPSPQSAQQINQLSAESRLEVQLQSTTTPQSP